MKKGKNILLFLLVVIFIVGSAGVGYFMGTNKQSNDTKTLDNNEDNKMSDETVDKLGRKLFIDTLSNDSYNYYFYDSDKLTVEKVSLEGKLISTMNNISFNNIYYNQVRDFTSQECLKESTDSNGFNYTCYVYKVNKDIFTDVYYDLFNQKLPTFNNFIYMDSLDYRVCKLEDNEIKCYPMDSGSDIDSARRYINYDKAEIDNGNLYVYSDFIAFDFENNTDNYYAYSDYNFTNKIGSIDYDEFENYNFEELFTKFKDKTGKYKLTFKQRENGTWYWESTEVVK